MQEQLTRDGRKARVFFNLVSPAFFFLHAKLLPDYRKLLADVALSPRLSVLDVGTGVGTLAAAFVERGHYVEGIDVAERLLARARKRLPGVKLHRWDAAKLPLLFKSSSFGVVAMAYLLHGMPRESRITVLKGARQVASNYVLVIDYCCPGPWYVKLIERIEGPHYFTFVREPLDSLAREAGLVVDRSGRVSAYMGWWLFKKIERKAG